MEEKEFLDKVTEKARECHGLHTIRSQAFVQGAKYAATLLQPHIDAHKDEAEKIRKAHQDYKEWMECHM